MRWLPRDTAQIDPLALLDLSCRSSDLGTRTWAIASGTLSERISAHPHPSKNLISILRLQLSIVTGS